MDVFLFGEEFDLKRTKATVKHGGGSVVWGCMSASASGVGCLVFIDGIMGQYVYRSILAENLEASADQLGLAGKFFLSMTMIRSIPRAL